MIKLNLYETIDKVAMEIRANDFHDGRDVEDERHYKSEAEKKINAMTNVELMELIFAEIERQNP